MVAVLGWALMWMATLWLNAIPAHAISGGTNIQVQGGVISITGQIGDANVADTITASNYCKLTGNADCVMTGPVTLDDTSLKITEGVDTMTITVPVLTGNRAVTFPDEAGAVCIGQTGSGCPTTSFSKSIVGFGSGMTVAQNTTVYIWPGLIDGTEANVAAPLDGTATFENMNCRSSAAPGGSDTFTVVLGSGTCGSVSYSTKLQCQISASGTTCDSATSSTAVTGGECVAVRLVSSATAASAYVSCTMERVA
jgi:hypothetical protein